jgi:hypothetical protein
VHSGFGTLPINTSFSAHSIPSYRDIVDSTIDRIFETNEFVLGSKHKLTAAVEQFCQSDPARREFFQRTGVDLNSKKTDFRLLNQILHIHRQAFTETSERRFGETQLLNQTEWFVFGDFLVCGFLIVLNFKTHLSATF